MLKKDRTQKPTIKVNDKICHPQIAHLGFYQLTQPTLKNQKSCFFANAPKKAIFDNLMKPIR